MGVARWLPNAAACFCLSLVSGCQPDDAAVLPGPGNWRLVNYWALWCTPCREEIPELNRLHELRDVTVLGVNFDGKKGSEREQHRAQLGIRFPALAEEPTPRLGIQRPQVLPTTLVINPQGEWVASLVGPQTESGVVAALARLGR